MNHPTSASSAATGTSEVYTLDGSRELSREQLGGKAFSLNEMARLAMPVPPAFTLGVELCQRFHDEGGRLPDEVWDAVRQNLARLGDVTGREFGGAVPLLVSVRSGAVRSMPGMMDTVLNLGLRPDALDRLGDAAWAADVWERFAHSFTQIVGVAPPADPWDQLALAVAAVFRSWESPRAVAYRDRYAITDVAGTSVTIQAMVFGNRDEQSGTGVMFSRDPNQGTVEPQGEWLARAQGEDVVSGSRTPGTLADLAQAHPTVHAELLDAAERMEQFYQDMVDMEFTVESGRLYLLQARPGKRTPVAAARIAVDLVQAGVIDVEQALSRLTVAQAEKLLEHTATVDTSGASALATGLAVGGGVATGIAVSDVDEALARADAGEQVVLVRHTTSPEDVPAMFAAVAVVTQEGGSMSHAALVCREAAIPCVVGCGDGTVERLVGTRVSVDASAGAVFAASAQQHESSSSPASPSQAVATLQSWAQQATGREGDLAELVGAWHEAAQHGAAQHGAAR